MSTVLFPFAYVPDPTKGRPVDSGFLFFGEPDLDPEIIANQITISGKQEDGTIVPLTQPVRTSAGGVPIFNGSPVVLVVSQDEFSFKVLNKKSTQVYYQENTDSILSGSEIEDLVLERSLIDELARPVTSPDLGNVYTTFEYNTGSGIGGGKYELVNSDPGFNSVNPAKTDGSGFWLKLIPVDSGVVLLSQSGALPAVDSTTNMQDLFDGYGDRAYLDVDCIIGTVTISSPSVNISGDAFLTGNIGGQGGFDLTDAVTSFIARDFTLFNAFGISTQNNTSDISRIIISNTTIRSCQIGYHFLGSARNVDISNNVFQTLNRTLADGSCQGVLIGQNIEADSDDTFNIHISDNTFNSIRNDFDRETHAVLVYGQDITITGNTVTDVFHSFERACEGLYTKGRRVTISNNTLVDCGPSNDGCINIKGESKGVSGVKGFDNAITGNVIINNKDEDVIGININTDNVTVTGNNLFNCYPKFTTKSNATLSGNTVTIEKDNPSGGVGFFFEIENYDQIDVLNNTFIAEVNNFTVNTFDISRIRNTSSPAAVMTGLRIKGNTFNLSANSLVGANYLALITLNSETSDITGLDISFNDFIIDAPSASQTDINAVSFQFTNTISGTIRDNFFNELNLYADNNSWANRDIRFYRNALGESIELTAGNAGLSSRASDVEASNIGATGIRTFFLPQARVGINFAGLCISPTFAMVMDADGADIFTDGSGSKSLAVGASANISCFTAGVWHVVTQAGSVT